MNKSANQRIPTTVGEIEKRRALFCLSVVLVSSFLFGYVLPTIVALADGHFHTSDFEKRIEESFPGKIEELTKFNARKDQLRHTVTALEIRIKALAENLDTDTQSINQLFDTMEELNVYVNRLKAPFRVRAFEKQTITRYWVLSYFFLGTLLAVSYLDKPRILPSKTCWQLFALLLALTATTFFPAESKLYFFANSEIITDFQTRKTTFWLSRFQLYNIFPNSFLF